MKVAHVDTSLEWRGGQTQLLHLLRHRPMDCAVIHPNAPLRQELEARKITYHTVDFRGAMGGATSLRRLLNASEVDLIAAHTSHAHSQCILARPSVPLVVHRRLDFMHRPNPVRRWKYARAAGYIAVSEAVRKVLLSLGVSDDRIYVVYDGVDDDEIRAAIPKRAAFCAELGWSADVQLVLAVGALVAHKGHRYLLDAIRELPKVHLAIAGVGELDDVLRRQIREQGLSDRVALLGTRSDVFSLLKSVDLFCHPSTEEGLGQVVAEALIAGVPVVATRAGGVPEVLGEYGWMVAPGDSAALARAISAALSGVQVRTPIGSIPGSMKQFSVAALVEGTVKAYAQLCSSSSWVEELNQGVPDL